MKKAKSRKSLKKLEEQFIRIRLEFPKSLKTLGKERRNQAAQEVREMRRMCRGHNEALVAGKRSFARSIEKRVDRALIAWNAAYSLGFNRSSKSWNDGEKALVA